MPVEFQRIKCMFLAAVEKSSGAERDEFLKAACGADEALHRQVEALLRRHDQAGNFLEPEGHPSLAALGLEEAEAGASKGDEGAASEVGTRIGPYKLLQKLGEGGMGAVWVAEQQEGVIRRVALKVIKPGLDSKQIIARFEAERQALALMDHPNIAKVLDAGTFQNPKGRPFFVMELVKGSPINKYCDQEHLTPRERLELFIPVCQAVQHAHQKGIIHRDLKPSNLLVALYDGKPIPKVIDFGVAKATAQKLTERTLYTEVGQMVGTLEYMAPEQAELNNFDIDTRADIYSLGVVLYELLTGSPPFTGKQLRSAAFSDMLRMIREIEPPKPSTKLSSSEELPAIAASRKLEPKKLTRLLHGELDWIVMKCLEKDRGRRYETANDLAMDLRRYLTDEPVLAGPPSVFYKVLKFSRRHKTGMGVAGLVLFFLMLLGGGVGWVLRDRDALQSKMNEDAERALDRAELFQEQGKRAEALASFERAEMLIDGAPNAAVRKRLNGLKDRLDAEARDQDFVRRFEDIRLLEQSQIKAEQNLYAMEDAYPKIFRVLCDFGIPMGSASPPDVVPLIQARPEAVQTQLLAALHECLVLCPPDEGKMRAWLGGALDAADGDSWRNEVRKLHAAGNLAELKKLAGAVDVAGQPPSFLLWLAKTFAVNDAARFDLLQRIQRAYPHDFWANQALGWDMVALGAPREAMVYYAAALALRPRSAGIRYNRGNALWSARDLNGAIAELRQAVSLAPDYGAAHNTLGNVLREKGHPEAASAAHLKAIEVAANHPIDRAHAHHCLGRALYQMKDLEGAIAAHRQAVALNPNHSWAHYFLGDALREKGDLGNAITHYRLAADLAPHNPQVWYILAQALLTAGDLDARQKILAVMRAQYAKTMEPAWADRFLFAYLPAPAGLMDNAELIALGEAAVAHQKNPRILGAALYRAGKHQEAIEKLEEGVKMLAPRAWDHLFLAMAHHRLGNKEKAREYFDLAVVPLARAGYSWPENAESEYLRREAEALLK